MSDLHESLVGQDSAARYTAPFPTGEVELCLANMPPAQNHWTSVPGEEIPRTTGVDDVIMEGCGARIPVPSEGATVGRPTGIIWGLPGHSLSEGETTTWSIFPTKTAKASRGWQIPWRNPQPGRGLRM